MSFANDQSGFRAVDELAGRPRGRPPRIPIGPSENRAASTTAPTSAMRATTKKPSQRRNRMAREKYAARSEHVQADGGGLPGYAAPMLRFVPTEETTMRGSDRVARRLRVVAHSVAASRSRNATADAPAARGRCDGPPPNIVAREIRSRRFRARTAFTSAATACCMSRRCSARSSSCSIPTPARCRNASAPRKASLVLTTSRLRRTVRSIGRRF